MNTVTGSYLVKQLWPHSKFIYIGQFTTFAKHSNWFLLCGVVKSILMFINTEYKEDDGSLTKLGVETIWHVQDRGGSRHSGGVHLQAKKCGRWYRGTLHAGSCGSGVELVSCYQKVAGSVPLVCMSKCPGARYWTQNCSRCAGWHLAWQPPPSMYECIYELQLQYFGQKCLLNANVLKRLTHPCCYTLKLMQFRRCCARQQTAW